MSRLSGLPIPDRLLARFDHAGDAAAARRIGLEITAEHTAAILDQGADGLHFYTFNDLSTTEGLLTALYSTGVSLTSFQRPPHKPSHQHLPPAPPRRWPPSSGSAPTPQKESQK